MAEKEMQSADVCTHKNKRRGGAKALLLFLP